MSAWFYRSLGVAARLNLTTSHIRLRGIPLNWVIAAGMGLCVAWQGGEFVNALVANPQPRQVAISDIKDRPIESSASDYVTVRGRLFPESELRVGSTPYIPLIEEDTRRAILVRASHKNSDRLESRHSSITGQLQPIAPERQIIVSQADLGHNVYLETAWSLTEGTRPHTAWQHGVVAGGTGGLFAVFAIALAKQGIIFEALTRKMDYKVVPPFEGEPIDLHISACLALFPPIPQGDERTLPSIARQTFVDIPGTIGSSEAGELVLMANVDASSRGGLAVAARKAGWWKSAIASRSIRHLETGYLHLGRERRPALRFSYCEPTGNRRTAVVSFASPLQQQYTFNHLVHSSSSK